MTTRALLACILAIAFAGCGDDDGGLGPDGGPGDAGAGDAGAGDAATGDGGTPPGIVVERWGGRVYGPVLALTRVDRTLWMGMNVVEDPTSASGSLRYGLVRLDLDSGAMRVFEDELGAAPLPTAGVVQDGARTLVVTPEGLVSIDGDTVELHPLARSDGEPLEPTRAVLDRPASGDARLWVSTHLGLVLVDPDTLDVRASSFPIGGPTGALAVDPETRDVYITDLAAGAIARVQYAPEGPVHTSWIHLGAGGVTHGTPGDVVWSAELGALLIAVASYDADTGGVISWDGGEVRTILTEGQLSLASHGAPVPFGAQVLAIDEADHLLIVGGQIRPGGFGGPSLGGGLAWVDLASVGDELRVAGADVRGSAIGGDFVAALAYDPVTNRTFASLRHPCSEFKLGNVGVDVLTFDGSTLQVGTATLSGVRDLELHDGTLWAAVRDDIPGLACEGLGTQGGLFAVHGARGGTAPEWRTTHGDGDLEVWRPARIAPNRLAFRDPDHRIVASFRDTLFVGRGESGVSINPAAQLGVNLRTHAAVWLDADTFWLGGPAAHSEGDGVALGDVGPRGAVRVDLDGAGGIGAWRRYVRASRDVEAFTTTGLPSANVTDIVIDSGDHGGEFPAGTITYLISGIERFTSQPFDRTEAEPFAPDAMIRRGGVTVIAADGSMAVLDDGDDVPDGRAAAVDPTGVLWVLDAERGLLRREGERFVPAPMAGVTVPAGSTPTDLYVEEGWMVATYSTGAAVRIGESTAWVDGAGWTWTAIERAPGVLLIGADSGLLRVRLETATDPGERAAAVGGMPFGRAR